jgi:hypothetical protein
MTTANASRGASRITGSSKQAMRSGQSSGRWDKLGANQGDVDPENASYRMGSSVDDIPLVSGLKQADKGGIQKTTEFVVSHGSLSHDGANSRGLRGY